MDETWLAGRIAFLIPLLFSLTIHEWAHAYCAWLLGDDTASYHGRLSLNPVVHMDPVGTFLLPLLGVPFGWAKPVPVNPARFRQDIRLSTGIMLVAAAGPLSNLLLASMSYVLLGMVLWSDLSFFEAQASILHLLETSLILNVILAVFNLLPIPPLDGSRILDALIPDGLRKPWNGFCQYGPVALLGIILLPLYCGVSVVSWPVEQLQAIVLDLLRQL